MKNFSVIFIAVKQYTVSAGSGEISFRELERRTRQPFFPPIYLYLEALDTLGLIRINALTQKITLTQKGKNTSVNFPFGMYAYLLLTAYFLRQALLFLIFWPMLLSSLKTNSTQTEENTAG